MSNPIEHDTRAIALAEIDRHAFAIGVYAENIRNYAAIGDVDGLEHALRSAVAHVRLAVGEFLPLTRSEAKEAA